MKIDTVTMQYDLDGETRELNEKLAWQGEAGPQQALAGALGRMRAKIREMGGKPGSWSYYYWDPYSVLPAPLGT